MVKICGKEKCYANSDDRWCFFAFLNNAKTSELTTTICGTIYFFNFLIFLFFGFVIALVSFLPQTKPFWIWKGEKLARKPNIFFYGDLATIDPIELPKFIYPESAMGDEKHNSIRISIAEQIVINSKIAKRKFEYFRIAMWCIFSAMLTPMLGIILYLIFDPHSSVEVRHD